MPYPETLPLAEAQRAIQILRNGEIVSRKKRLASDIYEVQGFAFKVIIGEPEPEFGVVAEVATQAETPEQIEAIHNLLVEGYAAADVTMPYEGVIDKLGKIDWKKVFEMVMVLLPLLMKENQ